MKKHRRLLLSLSAASNGGFLPSRALEQALHGQMTVRTVLRLARVGLLRRSGHPGGILSDWSGLSLVRCRNVPNGYPLGYREEQLSLSRAEYQSPDPSVASTPGRTSDRVTVWSSDAADASPASPTVWSPIHTSRCV